MVRDKYYSGKSMHINSRHKLCSQIASDHLTLSLLRVHSKSKTSPPSFVPHTLLNGRATRSACAIDIPADGQATAKSIIAELYVVTFKSSGFTSFTLRH